MTTRDRDSPAIDIVIGIDVDIDIDIGAAMKQTSYCRHTLSDTAGFPALNLLGVTAAFNLGLRLCKSALPVDMWSKWP